MFDRHVIKKLSAYCQGELDADDASRVREHLSRCHRCSAEKEEIELGIHLAERLPQVPAPASLWSEIEASLDKSSNNRQVKPAGKRFWLGSPALTFATAALVVAAAVAVALYVRQDRNKQDPSNQDPSKPSWAVAAIEGSPKVDSRGINETGRLAVGGALETDSASRARIEVADIGEVEVEPNTRMRLVETSEDEHRLALDRGSIEAKITAPPRLFFVDTPSAVAIDLGCVYSLEVDEAGNGLLHVTVGWVELVRDGRNSYVPVGTMCLLRAGVGPGTPYFDDTSDRFRQALEQYDFDGGGEESLAVVLSEARARDTLTLWHLLPRVDEAGRKKVLDRMIALVGLPKGVTRAGLMRLDPKMVDLELWKEYLDLVWF
ncbi:MAG TPA: zf-HC2 domain-containing protein [Blastocatellia bacterium]|nr:zf-HC2 domain-containing protein [Blastocatellia bacterium]